ncbi:hypothetical protein LCGC14_0971390 [marine sediment metagenome]|uniref:Uncharacterized protein n=1 Tax=marine sediment metagenome TaxID=412755 RepID=A0A0F9NXS0_9ZZZZ
MPWRFLIPIWLLCIGLSLIPSQGDVLDKLVTMIVFGVLGFCLGYEVLKHSK